MNDRSWEIFFELHSGLPREAPGADEQTRAALRCCQLPDCPAILDIGCGPGGQTIVAAQEFPGGTVVAVDTHRPFLIEVNRRAARQNVSHRVHAMYADMTSLPFGSDRFDLVLAEGSAYVMGVENALKSWRDLLRRAGHVAFTELVWLTDDPPIEAKEFFDAEYPSMTTVDATVRLINGVGYHLLDHFTLPDSAWWDSYYTPLEQRVEELRQKYSGDSEALAVIAESQMEVDIRRRHGSSYGYEFFVARS